MMNDLCLTKQNDALVYAPCLTEAGDDPSQIFEIAASGPNFAIKTNTGSVCANGNEVTFCDKVVYHWFIEDQASEVSVESRSLSDKDLAILSAIEAEITRELSKDSLFDKSLPLLSDLTDTDDLSAVNTAVYDFLFTHLGSFYPWMTTGKLDTLKLIRDKYFPTGTVDDPSLAKAKILEFVGVILLAEAAYYEANICSADNIDASITGAVKAEVKDSSEFSELVAFTKEDEKGGLLD